MVVSNGMLLAGFRIAAGLLIAPLAGRAVASMLYGVGAADVFTLAIAPVIILLVTYFGSLAPGSRAARTEPMSALREH